MPRICIACGRDVAEAAYCPYCSQPTADDASVSTEQVEKSSFAPSGMEQLPTGFRVVGGLSEVYGVVTGGCFTAAIIGSQATPKSNPRNVPSHDLLDWMIVLTFAFTSVVLLIGGCLLFARAIRAIRAARQLLFVATVGLASEAVVVTIATVQEFQHPSSSTGALIVLVTVPVFIVAASWSVVVLMTGVKLGRHLR